MELSDLSGCVENWTQMLIQARTGLVKQKVQSTKMGNETQDKQTQAWTTGYEHSNLKYW